MSAVVERATHDAVVEATAETEARMVPQSVPVNVYESSNALVIVAPLPAVTANDVTIELRPGVVRFWASVRSAGPAHTWSMNGHMAATSAASRSPRVTEAPWKPHLRMASSRCGSSKVPRSTTSRFTPRDPERVRWSVEPRRLSAAHSSEPISLATERRSAVQAS